MNISYSDVEACCNELHNLTKQIQNVLDSVDSAFTKIKSNDVWTGSASDYYSEKALNLSSNFDSIVTEIENSILYMAYCSDGYSAIDEAIITEICNNLNITTPNLSTSNIFKE